MYSRTVGRCRAYRHGKIRTSNTFCQRKTSEYYTTEDKTRRASPDLNREKHTYTYLCAHQSHVSRLNLAPMTLSFGREKRHEICRKLVRIMANQV